MAPKPRSKAKPRTIDAYLARLSSDKRAALESLRKTIRAAAPGAEESISYQLPAFRLDGKVLLWFGAAANHCAIYGGSTLSLGGSRRRSLHLLHCSRKPAARQYPGAWCFGAEAMLVRDGEWTRSSTA